MKRFFLIFAICFLTALFFFVLFVSLLGWGSGLEQNVDFMLEGPTWSHWFGRDMLGRDLLSRVLHGGRVSLVVGLVCSFTSCLIGFIYGSISGWSGGFTDRIMMRFLDVLTSIPSFILVATLCLSVQVLLPIEDSFLKAFVSLCVGISATHWMGLARVTRSMVMELKSKPFVEAAVALGGSRIHIMWRHILPNMIGTLIILMALQIPTNILYESFMSFVGLGIHPPYTSWGILVREGWKTLSSFPHLILFPSAVLFLTVWSFHIVLDAIKTKFRW